MNSWDDKNFVAAIEKTGRKKIVLAGLWTETCVALPTVQALRAGDANHRWPAAHRHSWTQRFAYASDPRWAQLQP